MWQLISIPKKVFTRLLLLLLTAVVIVATLLFGLAFSSEPRYHRRAVSSWLEDWYRLPTWSSPISVQQWRKKREEATVAVRELGTNAIPPLTRMLRRRDSWVKV